MKTPGKSCHRMIEERIAAMSAEDAFVTSDFCDVADADTASRALLRLRESGKIKRVMHGVYARVSYAAEETTPDHVAHAIARGNRWTIAPSGDTALYLAGVITEKPRDWTYVTDGTYRSYTLADATIRFLHTSGKLLSAVSEKTALVIQVIRAYGKEKINDELLRYLSRILCHGNEETLMRETKHMSQWIYHSVCDMCRWALGKNPERQTGSE